MDEAFKTDLDAIMVEWEVGMIAIESLPEDIGSRDRAVIIAEKMLKPLAKFPEVKAWMLAHEPHDALAGLFVFSGDSEKTAREDDLVVSVQEHRITWSDIGVMQ